MKYTICWLHYLTSTIDINGDFAKEHCLVYANFEVLYRGELYSFINQYHFIIQYLYSMVT